ncbi:MAG: hypothetical protein PHC71_04040 [Candidatus Omnitrophica bacterium]|nr:hypothetical protein [Candidatus Omnitrophota bacterium]
MMIKKSVKPNVFLYEQELKPQELLDYLPEDLKNKLSRKDKERIIRAFYLTVVEYKNRYEEKYLDKMLI